MILAVRQHLVRGCVTPLNPRFDINIYIVRSNTRVVNQYMA